MPYQLKGRTVLVTGGSRGLGAVVCEHFAAEGCNIAINYNANKDAAEELAQSIEAKHKIKVITLAGDAADTASNIHLIADTVQAFGKIDIIICNAGWTKFSDFDDLDALDEEEWDKAWAVNVKAPLTLLKAALPHFQKNAEGGVFMTTNSIAGTTIGGSSMAYCVTKAAQLRLMKCLAKTQGPSVRINSVLPGLLLTEWGLKYGTDRLDELKEQSALRRETALDDCADVFVMLARNTSMTGQNVQVDAGLNIANMG